MHGQEKEGVTLRYKRFCEVHGIQDGPLRTNRKTGGGRAISQVKGRQAHVQKATKCRWFSEAPDVQGVQMKKTEQFLKVWKVRLAPWFRGLFEILAR